MTILIILFAVWGIIIGSLVFIKIKIHHEEEQQYDGYKSISWIYPQQKKKRKKKNGNKKPSSYNVE